MTVKNIQTVSDVVLREKGESRFSDLLLFNTLQSNSLPTVQIIRIRLKQ